MANGYVEHPGWPTMDYARSLIEPINSFEELRTFLKKLLDEWQAVITTDVKEARARAICISETLLMYPNLWTLVIRGENLENDLYNKFNEYDHLGEYVKYLETTFNKRRAIVKAFTSAIALAVTQKKLSAQQKYITHILSNVTNFDCAGVIASFI